MTLGASGAMCGDGRGGAGADAVGSDAVPESADPCGSGASMAFETRSVHAGYDRLAHAHAVSVPLYQSVAYGLEDAARGDALACGAMEGFEYSRVANPTVDVLEKRIASLEGGESAVAVASGMAAVSYALMCAAEGGGRIIAPTNLYGASVDAMDSFFPQFGIHTDVVDDINDLAQVEAAIGEDTRAVFAETVANPSTRVTDVRALADLAHRHGIALIVDNTVPTPYLFRPIDFGADIVVHSTTKGLSGHGNALGGIVVDAGRFDWSGPRFAHLNRVEQVISDDRSGQWRSFVSAFGRQAFIRRIRIKYLRTFGAVMSPFNAYLQLVGLETLSQRVGQESATALRVARHLRECPHVRAVHYCGLEDHPQRDLVRSCMPHGAPTILSFELEGGPERLERVVNAVRVFSYVANIGDSRSLIVNPARITHREVPQAYRQAAGVGDEMLRLSIGLEGADDLIADLDQALAVAYESAMNGR